MKKVFGLGLCLLGMLPASAGVQENKLAQAVRDNDHAAIKKLLASHPEASNEGYLSSHPSTDERMRHLRKLAGSSK